MEGSGLNTCSEEDSSAPVGRVAVSRNQTVKRFGGGRKAGQMVVQPNQPTVIGGEPQSLKDGEGSREHASVRLNQLHGPGESSGLNLRVLVTNVLGGGVRHGVSGELFPVLDPDPAKAATPVEYQQRPVRHARVPQASVYLFAPIDEKMERYFLFLITPVAHSMEMVESNETIGCNPVGSVASKGWSDSKANDSA
jgi:hypothetical protein